MKRKNCNISAAGVETLSVRVKKDLRRNYSLYILVLPVLVIYALFMYKPMYGLLIAFEKFNIRAGILGSQWVGFDNFARFFGDPYFWRNIKNTFLISFYSILFGFPAPIILALLINELKSKSFAKLVQTVTYLPHFISLVVICGMVRTFVASDGLITELIFKFTGAGINESLLNNESMFIPIYVLSSIWQEVGWGCIVYLAALSAIDTSLYEAAVIDGANRWKQTLYVTIPGISTTIIIMFILRMGSILSVGYEKIMLLINPFNAEKSTVLSYYAYQKGLLANDYGLSTAAGFFNSVINVIFVVLANKLSRKYSETSLW